MKVNVDPTVTRDSPPSPVSLYTGDRQTFTASATDPDNNLKSYEWFVGDRSQESSPIWFGALPTGSATDDFSHTFSSAGRYTVTATFTDAAGGSDSVSWTVVVIDPSRPSVDRVSPTQELLLLDTGDSQSFTVRATDADNDLTKWQWEADWHGIGLAGHIEPEASFALTGDIPKTFSYTFDTAGTWTVTATFTDSRGESGSVSWSVTVADNRPPTVVRLLPREADISLNTTQGRLFYVKATDPDGNLAKWKWKVDKHFSLLHGHEEPEESIDPTGDIIKSFWTAFPDDGTYTVKVTFTDSEGQSGYVEWRVEVADGPDLSVKDLELMSFKPAGEVGRLIPPPIVGDSFEVELEFENHTSEPSGAYDVNLYLKIPEYPMWDADGISEGRYHEGHAYRISDVTLTPKLSGPQLGGNESKAVIHAVEVPSNIAAGPYWLCAQIEYDGIVLDLQEINNALCEVIYVVSHPDIAEWVHPVHPYYGAYGRIWMGMMYRHFEPKLATQLDSGLTYNLAYEPNRVDFYRRVALELATRRAVCTGRSFGCGGWSARWT